MPDAAADRTAARTHVRWTAFDFGFDVGAFGGAGELFGGSNLPGRSVVTVVTTTAPSQLAATPAVLITGHVVPAGGPVADGESDVAPPAGGGKRRRGRAHRSAGADLRADGTEDDSPPPSAGIAAAGPAYPTLPARLPASSPTGWGPLAAATADPALLEHVRASRYRSQKAARPAGPRDPRTSGPAAAATSSAVARSFRTMTRRPLLAAAAVLALLAVAAVAVLFGSAAGRAMIGFR